MSTSPRLRIEFLGPSEIYLDGQPVGASRWPRVIALLAYLIVESRQHPREELAALFWPDTELSKARLNLRQLLRRLRKLVGDDRAEPRYLVTDREIVEFRVGGDVWVDLWAFESLVASTRRHRHRRLAVCFDCVASLEKAHSLYRGPFLQGTAFTESPELDTWLLLRRESLERDLRALLLAIGESYLLRGEPEEALRYLTQLRSLDRWDERGERLLLRALHQMHGPHAALKEYRQFRQALRAELGAEPEDETQSLMVHLSSGGKGVSQGAVPEPVTPLFGRAAEMAMLESYLADQDRRLITLVGAGGIGKTRLALEVARRQRPYWRDGVWFVPLVGMARAIDLPEVIISVISPRLGERQMATTRLLHLVRDREMLLVLDNFETMLPDGRGFLRQLLSVSPGLKILVTSQTPLFMPEEWLVRLEGLPYAMSDDGQESFVDFDSVRLFLYHAQRVKAGWEPSTAEWPAVMRICRLLQGMPLGLELAAAWVRILPCKEIAAAIADNPDSLRQVRRTGPPRHYSLRAVFSYTYALLPGTLQCAVRQLSVFQGDFSATAARAVAGADLTLLSSLVDWSLLRVSGEGRYAFHPLVRAYAFEALAERSYEKESIQREHARYYIRFLHAREAMLRGSGEEIRRSLSEINAELSNVVAAWEWAIEHLEVALLSDGLEACFRFFSLSGFLEQGEILLRQTAERLVAQLDRGMQKLHADVQVKRALLLVRQGHTQDAIKIARRASEEARGARDLRVQAMAALALGEALRYREAYAAARCPLEQALSLARAAQARGVEAQCLRLLGSVLWAQSDFEGARGYLLKALAIDRALEDRHGEGWTHNSLGLVAENTFHYDEAIAHYREALRTMVETGDLWGQSIVLGNLGYIYARLGARAEARRYFQRDLQVCRQVGDRRGASWTLSYLSLVLSQDHEWHRAEQYARQALALAQAVDDLSLQAQALTHLGHALTGLTQWGDAEAAYRQAHALRMELGQDALALETSSGLVRINLQCGAPHKALELAEPILEAIISQSLLRTEECLRIYWTCYQALHVNGDPRAWRVLMAAWDLLQVQASHILDPQLRRTFLEEVEAHRQIVAAYEKARTMFSARA